MLGSEIWSDGADSTGEIEKALKRIDLGLASILFPNAVVVPIQWIRVPFSLCISTSLESFHYNVMFLVHHDVYICIWQGLKGNVTCQYSCRKYHSNNCNHLPFTALQVCNAYRKCQSGSIVVRMDQKISK